MVLTINSLLEALTGGERRREHRFYLSRDERGEARFRLPENRMVDFEVVMGGVDSTMRCPLVWDDETRQRLRKMEGWRLLEGALMVFAESGEVVEIDVLVRPTTEGTKTTKVAVPGTLTTVAGRCEEFTWDPVWEVGVAMDEGRWFLVDGRGRELTDTPYDWLGECSEGLILAGRDGKYGFIDTRGREKIPFIYDDASSFSGGRTLVTRDGESFYIAAN